MSTDKQLARGTYQTDDNGLMRTRREAAWRCEPLLDGRRDPLDKLAQPSTSATYGLSVAERAAEARRLLAAGWFPGEVPMRLALACDWAKASKSPTYAEVGQRKAS